MPFDRSLNGAFGAFSLFVAPAVGGPLGGRGGLRAVSRGDRSVGRREEGLSEVYQFPPSQPHLLGVAPSERRQSPDTYDASQPRGCRPERPEVGKYRK